jgi:hypothetical protein
MLDCKLSYINQLGKGKQTRTGSVTGKEGTIDFWMIPILSTDCQREKVRRDACGQEKKDVFANQANSAGAYSGWGHIGKKVTNAALTLTAVVGQ